MSTERVRNSLHEHLSMEKLCARVVAAFDQKLTRKTVSIENLTLNKGTRNEFLHRFIPVNEIWIHHYTPKSQQSKQWIRLGEQNPKKTNTILSANTVMTTVFLRCERKYLH